MGVTERALCVLRNGLSGRSVENDVPAGVIARYREVCGGDGGTHRRTITGVGAVVIGSTDDRIQRQVVARSAPTDVEFEAGAYFSRALR